MDFLFKQEFYSSGLCLLADLEFPREMRDHLLSSSDTSNISKESMDFLFKQEFYSSGLCLLADLEFPREMRDHLLSSSDTSII